MSSFCHQESSASSDSSCEHNVHDNLAELSPQERQRAFALRFRTEMCRSYVSTGRCEYRDRCMFAHGDRELRTEAMNETEGLVCDKAIRAWMRERRLAAAQQSRRRGGNMRGVAVVTRASYTAPRPVMAPRRVEVALTVEVAQPQQPIKKIAESPAESELFVPANLSRSTTTSVSSSEGINPTAPVVPAIKGYRFNPYSMILPKVYA